jgi:hypothetical protein
MWLYIKLTNGTTTTVVKFISTALPPPPPPLPHEMTKTGPTAEIYLAIPETRPASLKELCVEGVVPLLLDAFSMQLWLMPLVDSIMGSIPMGASATASTLCVAIILAVVTFVLNVSVYPHLHPFLAHSRVGDSPLFRAVWVYTCAAAVTRYTGGAGVMSFSIVTFVPFVYVRVPDILPVFASLYACVFFVFIAVHNVMSIQAGGSRFARSRVVHSYDVYSMAMHSIVFISSSLYHAVWIASHKYTSDPAQQPVSSYLFLRWRRWGILPALFRTLVLVLCMLNRDGSETAGSSSSVARYQNHDVFRFLMTLCLFATISIYTSWTHCQHLDANKLRNILSASVVAATCGVLALDMEQIAFLCVAAPLAIWTDITSLGVSERIVARKRV